VVSACAAVVPSGSRTNDHRRIRAGDDDVRPGSERRVPHRQHRRRLRRRTRGRDLLNVPAVVAERLEAQSPHLGADIHGRQLLVARPAAPALERVAGEKLHVRPDRGFGDRAGLAPGDERQRDTQYGRQRRNHTTLAGHVSLSI
jgi:hypothetical protein